MASLPVVERIESKTTRLPSSEIEGALSNQAPFVMRRREPVTRARLASMGRAQIFEFRAMLANAIVPVGEPEGFTSYPEPKVNL
jgi:hypothetical protein